MWDVGCFGTSRVGGVFFLCKPETISVRNTFWVIFLNNIIFYFLCLNKESSKEIQGRHDRSAHPSGLARLMCNLLLVLQCFSFVRRYFVQL